MVSESDRECNTLLEIERFGGYSHYKSTLNAMKKNIEIGLLDIIAKNN